MPYPNANVQGVSAHCSILAAFAFVCVMLLLFALVCVPLLCAALSAGKTKITKCQPAHVRRMYGASTEQVRSRYGASPNLVV